MAQVPGQQRHEREQSQQDRGRASNGLGRPLPLGLQPRMRPGLRTGPLPRPAPDNPLQELHRRCRRIGTAEGFIVQIILRVAHQDIANRHRGQAWGVPQRCARKDPPRLALAAIPVHFDRLPGGI